MSKSRIRKSNKPKNTKSTFTRLLSYLKPYKFKVILSYLLIIISSMGMVASAYFLKPIVNKYILPGNFRGLFYMLLLMGTINIVTSLSSYLYRRTMVTISQKVIYTIRNQLFEHVQRLPISYFDENSHGDLMSKFTNDVDNLNDALASSLLDLVSSIMTFTGTVVMMIILSPVLFIITLISILIIFFIINRMGGRTRIYFREQQKYLGEVNGYVEEMIKWQKVLKVFRYEKRAEEDFKVKNEKLRISQTNAQAEAYSMSPTIMNLTRISYAIICVLGGVFAIRGIFDLGTLIAYLQYSRRISEPLGNSTQNINSVFSALAGAERVFEILDLDIEIDDGKYMLVNVKETDEGLTLSKENSKRWAWYDKQKDELVELKGLIEFKDISFGYREDKKVLKNISFYAEPGQRLAFVGSTGAGKTTIMNLITRFYEPDSGSINFDGINIKEIKKSDLRRALGMVLQDVKLFSGTVADNIKYGKKGAGREQIIRAAELSNAGSFIKHLKYGYSTRISGSASDLSQGERQLLSIARAAISDPPVLILDEATSSIDTRTEKIIQDGMYKLMEGRTVLVIAHRLSTIEKSDVIFVMENGEIIERGNHEKLIKEKGRYYELYTGKAILS
ncbi:MAG: ABC transporter ATP-binding protein [Tissierellia bacterium]|nr:ABC transporter ATP-binding protein [Tissierellia bacterium]